MLFFHGRMGRICTFRRYAFCFGNAPYTHWIEGGLGSKMGTKHFRDWHGLSGVLKFAAGVTVGASLSCAFAFAGQTLRHDGVFWKTLGKPDKTAYVDGYSDAARASLGKLDQLKVAAGLFHWKGADKILSQVGRGLDLSGLPSDELVAYLDNLYQNPRYGDFDVANAIDLAVMHGIDSQLLAQKSPPQSSKLP